MAGNPDSTRNEMREIGIVEDLVEASLSPKNAPVIDFDPYDWPIAWLAAIERQHMRNSTEMLTAQNLHHREFRILIWLGRDPGVGVGALAECVGLERPTVSKMVDRLVEQRLLERRRHPHDGRRTALYLTDEGRRKLDQAIPFVRGLLGNYFHGLSAEEQETLMRLLKKFGKNVKNASLPLAAE